jgi:diguanylate cyclase (GGDEF)-like protein
MERPTNDGMWRGVAYLEGLPRGTVLVAALGLVFAVAWLDHETGIYLGLWLLYLIPVSLVTWVGGRGQGLVVAVAATLAGFGSDFHLQGVHLGLLALNTFSRLLISVFIVLMLDRLRRMLGQAERLARTDPLTGAANVRYFDEVAARELRGAERYGHSVTLAYLDVDDFKRVNDTLGHHGGDRVLETVAITISKNIRPTDLLTRVGGDEFAVLLPQTDVASAATMLERIRARLAEEMESRGWDITLSVGIAAATGTTSADALLGAADRLMYESKRAGKDRVTAQELAIPA